MTGVTRSAAWQKVNRLRRQRRVQNGMTLGLVVLGPVLAVATYLGLGPAELDPTSRGIRLILLADLVYALAIAALVFFRIAKLVANRRRNSAGSQLHLRLTGVFTIVALLPTVLVAIFAVITLNFGLEGWFSDRVRNVVGSSLSAAEAYEREQRDTLADDTRRLARNINTLKQGTSFTVDSDLRQILSQAQSQIQRGVKEAYIVDGIGQLKVRGERSYLFGFEKPRAADFASADQGETVIIEDWDNNEFRALMRLDAFTDRYVYLSREVDGEILSLLDDTQENVRLYHQLEADRGRLLFEFGLIYLGFAVILILAAIWLGLWFAERLSRPVGQLAGAAQRVGAGDLDVQVGETRGQDEIAMLGRVFNQMTLQLKGQRDALVRNTEQIERRRRLFDSVLSSVTAGVIGLDAEARVSFLNRSANRLLSLPQDDWTGADLGDLVPEFRSVMERFLGSGLDNAQEEVKLTRRGKLENLLVRVARRAGEDGAPEGYVLAFDDVTELVTAQKMAAWGDVARRIAHEVKNPLTPIRLSAQRINRKFAPLAGDEVASLAEYTDVIVRQTEHLKRIVDEFSQFARMPEPERRNEDLSAVLRDAVLLQQTGQPDVSISLEAPSEPVDAEFDPMMIGQALTNLIKNAGEAIESYQATQPPEGYAPEIRVSLGATQNYAEIWIEDNGIGLPADRARLFEPYVTNRVEGTGLGLPIVKKIIEEHGGSFALEDARDFDGSGHHGAAAQIILPRHMRQQNDKSGARDATGTRGRDTETEQIKQDVA